MPVTKLHPLRAQHGLVPAGYQFPHLGIGHLIDADPGSIPPGASIRTWDCNLDRTGGVGQRGGIDYVAENGACGFQLDPIETTDPWGGSPPGKFEFDISNLAQTGGAADELILNVAEDYTINNQYVGRTVIILSGAGAGESKTIILGGSEATQTVKVNSAWSVHPDATSTYSIPAIKRRFNYNGPSAAAWRIVHSGGGVQESAVNLVGLNLGADLEEWTGAWVYIENLALVDRAFSRLEIESPGGGTSALGFDRIPLVNGWNFIFRRKKDWVQQVPPGVTWTNVSRLDLRFTATSPTFAIIDNWWLGPSHLYGLYNFRQSQSGGGRNLYIAAGRESIACFIPEEQRWRTYPGLGEIGKATAMTASTITLAVTADSRDGFYVGRMIRMDHDTTIAGQERSITAYNGTTKVATITPDWTAFSALGGQYIIGARTPGVPVSFITMDDFCYTMNGSQRPQLIIDDLTAYEAGIVPPSTQPTITITPGAGQVVSGTHTIALVFFSTVTGRESDPLFTAPFSVGASGSRIGLSNLPVSSDPKVTHLRIYRLAPGQPGYKRVSAALEGEVANGVTTFNDDAITTALGALLQGAPNYDLNGIPPNASVAAVSNNHVVYDDPAAGGRVKVSRANTGEQVPVDGDVPIDQGDNDEISGIASLFGNLAVFKHDSMYVGYFTGGGLQPFLFKRESDRIGTLSHRSIIASGGVARFRHSTGYYEMRADWAPYKISEGWDQQSLLPYAEPAITDFDAARGQLVTSAYLTKRDQIYWTETREPNTFPDVQCVLHEPLQKYSGWSFHRAPISIITTARHLVQHFELVIAGGGGGIVYELDRGHADDHRPMDIVAIDFDFMLPPLDAGEALIGLGPARLKQYRYIDMLMRPSGNWPLNFQSYYDWSLGSTESGTAQAGTLSTITLATSASSLDGFYVGAQIQIDSGTGASQVRTIHDYVGSTRVATVSVLWTTIPNATSVYTMSGLGQDHGEFTPALGGAGIGTTFAIGVSQVGAVGGNYQRALLQMGRHRSIMLRLRNNRPGEAPYVSNLLVWLKLRRTGERIM